MLGFSQMGIRRRSLGTGEASDGAAGSIVMNGGWITASTENAN